MPKPLSIIQKIELPLFKKHNIHVQIKRDDLIHDEISGNKWRKLKYNLLNFKQKKYTGALTFGGSFPTIFTPLLMLVSNIIFPA
jgi:1-aminocyclopropane-1-carboxylate deaminase